MNRKFLPGSIVADESLSARQIRVVANSGRPDRVGDILVAAGCKLDNYRRNPIVLSSHDPTKPIGKASVRVSGSSLEATIDFAPPGASREADEICALAKAGIINAVSVGFRPIETEPIRGGYKFAQWELLELSVVAVPCDPDALVIGRSMRSKSGRVLNARNAAALAELIRCLGKSERAHFDALDMLGKAGKHRATAARHANAIAASQDGDDDTFDPGDDDSNVELSFGRAANRARRRQIEIFQRSLPGATAGVSAESRRRMIEVAARATSA